MTSITVITIVVVALLTLLIFGLMWLGYSAVLRSYTTELKDGKHDRDILKEYGRKKHKLIGIILSCLVVVLLLSIIVCGIICRVNNDNLVINHKTLLVIKSNSMADFCTAGYAEEWANDRSLQFSFGDLCLFEEVQDDTELIKGEVYGYKYNNYVITHRLTKTFDDNTYEFRGDNNQTADSYHVKHGNILYHYTGRKIAGVGSFVLFAQSYFGLWSILCITGVIVSNEIICSKIDTLNRQRYMRIRGIFRA